MRNLALARTVHVLAVVLWIGGVAMVTMVLLPAVRSRPLSEDPFGLFEWIERRFAFHARILTVVAGASGFYMLYETGGWPRYLSPASWWLHAMTLVWALFTILLFVLEPLVLHRKLAERARTDPESTLAWIQRAHWVLLTVSLVAIAGAVAGSHGWTFVG